MTARVSSRNRMTIEADMAEPALAILKETFGSHPPEAIAAVIQALRGGIAWRKANVAWRVKGVSKFNALLTQSHVDVAVPTQDRWAAERSSAHNWARYYGHTIATRWLKHEGKLRVYLVQRGVTRG